MDKSYSKFTHVSAAIKNIMGKYHAQEWLDKIISRGHSLLMLNMPIEIVHFPSDGLSAAIDDLPIIESKYTYAIFDLKHISFAEGLCYDLADILLTPSFAILVKKKYEEMDMVSISKNNKPIKTSIIELFELIESTALENKLNLVFVFKYLTKDHVKQPLFKKAILNMEHFRTRNYGFFNFIFSTFEQIFAGNPIGNSSIVPKIFCYKDYISDDSILEVLEDMGINRSEVKNIKLLIDLTGHLIFLVKSIVRDLMINDRDLSYLNNLPIDKTFFDEFTAVTSRLNKVFSFLPNDHVKVLKLIAEGKARKVNLNSTSLQILKKVHIIDDKNQIISKIIEGYCKYCVNVHIDELFSSESSLTFGNVKIDLNTYEVFINNISINEYLSEYEYSLVNILASNRGKVVKREELAKEVWKDGYLEKYSDWALDKIISRTREKLRDNKPYDIILTLKSRGVMIK